MWLAFMWVTKTFPPEWEGGSKSSYILFVLGRSAQGLTLLQIMPVVTYMPLLIDTGAVTRAMLLQVLKILCFSFCSPSSSRSSSSWWGTPMQATPSWMYILFHLYGLLLSLTDVRFSLFSPFYISLAFFTAWPMNLIVEQLTEISAFKWII